VNLTKDAWFGATEPATGQPRDQRMAVGLREGLRGIAGWIARRRSRREAAALLAFSDRDLWDLGLSRSDIPGIMNGTYRRD
jgi:uncharacterized protein YjiS (DUF1127 family)